MITSRFEGLNMDLSNLYFHVCGCGAIGSSAAIQLARMGAVNFILYDMDIVEDVNIGVSQYDNRHINIPKVEALSSILTDINPKIQIDTLNKYFNEYLYNGGNDIVILGFDSMKSRLETVEIIWLKCLKSKWKEPLLVIDGRMGAEHYQQYIIKGPNILKNYKKVWYSDENSDSEPCNLKATSYCSNMAGSFIANAGRKYTTKQPFNYNFSFNFPIMRLSAYTK